MGLTSWIKRQIEGDPEERKFRKEAKAEAKKIEREAFHEHYKTALLEQATIKGQARADREAKTHGGGSGLLNTLGNIGANMNKASEGLVKGIEINPDGAKQDFAVVDPFGSIDSNSSSYYGNGNGNRSRRRKGNSLEVVDPFNIDELK